MALDERLYVAIIKKLKFKKVLLMVPNGDQTVEKCS